MALALDPNKTLFVHIHWMRYYDDRKGDEPFKGGQKSDGWMENYNFLDYEGNVFGGFWPGGNDNGHPKEVSVDRLAARGEVNAKGVTVLFFAPHPEDKHPRLVGWYNNATVYRQIQTHPDDGQWYNVVARFEDVHRIPHRERKRAFNFTGWWKQGAYRFGDTAPAEMLEAAQREIRQHSKGMKIT